MAVILSCKLLLPLVTWLWKYHMWDFQLKISLTHHLGFPIISDNRSTCSWLGRLLNDAPSLLKIDIIGIRISPSSCPGIVTTSDSIIICLRALCGPRVPTQDQGVWCLSRFSRSDGPNREVVMAPAPGPGHGGVICNIISIVTNTAVRSKIRERYLNFGWGCDLQNISCNKSAETWTHDLQVTEWLWE